MTGIAEWCSRLRPVAPVHSDDDGIGVLRGSVPVAEVARHHIFSTSATDKASSLQCCWTTSTVADSPFIPLTLRRANPWHQGRKTPAWGPLALASAGLVA